MFLVYYNNDFCVCSALIILILRTFNGFPINDANDPDNSPAKIFIWKDSFSSFAVNKTFIGSYNPNFKEDEHIDFIIVGLKPL